MNEVSRKILEQVNSVIIGKEAVTEKVLMAVLAQGHVLLEDVPGVGKTTMALAFARTLGLDSRRVQFTSDTMPSDIIGFSLYNKETGRFDYKSGAVMTNLLLADEINRTSSKTQSALLEAMEEYEGGRACPPSLSLLQYGFLMTDRVNKEHGQTDVNGAGQRQQHAADDAEHARRSALLQVFTGQRDPCQRGYQQYDG